MLYPASLVFQKFVQKLVLFLTPFQFVHLFCNLSQGYPAVLLMCFVSAAVILLASLALIVQVSLPYNKTGRASVSSFLSVSYTDYRDDG